MTASPASTTKRNANAPSRMSWNVGCSDEPGVRILEKKSVGAGAPGDVSTVSCDMEGLLKSRKHCDGRKVRFSKRSSNNQRAFSAL